MMIKNLTDLGLEQRIRQAPMTNLDPETKDIYKFIFDLGVRKAGNMPKSIIIQTEYDDPQLFRNTGDFLSNPD